MPGMLFKDERLYPSQILISGGIAGVGSRTLTSPLDVVKIKMQVGTQETKYGFRRSWAKVYAKDGTIKAFFKGNFVACIRIFPYSAIQFFIYNQLRGLNLGNDLIDRTTPSPFMALFAGGVSGIVATIIVYPLDMVKTRLTLNSLNNKSAKYHGIKEAFKTIYKEEGIFAFYKGLQASIIGIVPFTGGLFMAYEFLDRAWGKPKTNITIRDNFVNGCLAAAFAQTFSYPFDTIRKKLQAQSLTVYNDMKPDVDLSKGNTLLKAFRVVVSQNGILGLWRGTVANLIKITFYSGAMFASFEALRRFFLWQNGYTQDPFYENPQPGVDQSLKPNQLKQWYNSILNGGSDCDNTKEPFRSKIKIIEHKDNIINNKK